MLHSNAMLHVATLYYHNPADPPIIHMLLKITPYKIKVQDHHFIHLIICHHLQNHLPYEM